ncbi:MAG: hypothetical protein BMS9Abin29_1554 [Gemmatimonadota bacterium]|nr:MAG: hypothetical protein BMS9Abin29_1554 [Gemmatimonadota bacterium]
MIKSRGNAHLVLVSLFAALLTVGPLSGQSVLDRTPNLAGGWTGEAGTVYFNFLHRFWKIDAGDEKKIFNSPTFLLGVSLPGRVLLGWNYASNSLVDGEEFNETELYGRWAFLATSTGAPVDVAVTAAFNEAASSGDFELSVAIPLGSVTLHGVGRLLGQVAELDDETGWAVGGGAVIRLTDGIALAGDVVTLTDRDILVQGGTDELDVAWGLGLQLAIPATPHTVSLQLSNARTATLQGSSFGDGQVRYGFEFTIPFTLSRYFGKRRSRSTGEVGGNVAAEVAMNDQLRYTSETVRIRTGQAVRWTNTSRLIHTVTADPSMATNANSVALPSGAQPFDSGDLRPGEVFTHSFTEPGTYRYFCIPHEGAGMVATVIVSG